MINYKLAKELKEAGFPREKCSLIWKGQNVGLSTDELLKVPTLSELIEVCGYKIVHLQRTYANKWEARSGEDDILDKHSYYRACGLSPEEAVARLWLVLNKQNTTESTTG